MSKQGLSNNTKSYKPMIKSCYLKPDLSDEQKKLILRAISRFAHEAKERATNG